MRNSLITSKTIWSIFILFCVGIVCSTTGSEYALFKLAALSISTMVAVMCFMQEVSVFGQTEDDKALASITIIPIIMLILASSSCTHPSNTTLTQDQKILAVADSLQTSFLAAKSAYINIYEDAPPEMQKRMRQNWAPVFNSAQDVITDFVVLAVLWAETKTKPDDIDEKMREALKMTGESISILSDLQKENTDVGTDK